MNKVQSSCEYFLTLVAKGITNYKCNLNSCRNSYSLSLDFVHSRPRGKSFARFTGEICCVTNRWKKNKPQSPTDDLLRHLTVRLLPHDWPPSSPSSPPPFDFRHTHETLWTHARSQIRPERPVGSIRSPRATWTHDVQSP